jgi:hypothetical protein
MSVVRPQFVGSGALFLSAFLISLYPSASGEKEEERLDLVQSQGHSHPSGCEGKLASKENHFQSITRIRGKAHKKWLQICKVFFFFFFFFGSTGI